MDDDDDDPLARATSLQRSQGGVLTRAQAISSGLSPAQVQTLLRTRQWQAVRRGAYASTADLSLTAEAPDTVAARDAVAARIAAQAERHALDIAAWAALRRAVHVGSHRSAALVLGLPLLGPLPVLPQLSRSAQCTGDVSTSPGIHVVSLSDAELMRCRGVLVTAPARTICDLARTGSFREGVVAADAALHAGLPRQELVDAARRCARWPGGRTAMRVALFADERAETPLESLNRVAYLEEGLPTPRSQIDVYDPDGVWVARVDFLFEAQRTVGEADGLTKYRLQTGQPVPAWVSDALVLEKNREQRLRVCGLEVVRNGWDDAFRDQRALAERVRTHFGFAARYPAVAGVRFAENPVRRRRPLAWPLNP